MGLLRPLNSDLVNLISSTAVMGLEVEANHKLSVVKTSLSPLSTINK
jgi:hypothetical protein